MKQLVELSTYSKTSQLGSKERIRKVGTKYSRTNQFSCLGAECIVTIVQLSLLLSFKRCLVPYCITYSIMFRF